jgi:cytoskeleton protein RodZ
MSDELQKENSLATTPGDLLKHERERQGRTVQQIAVDLHIGAYMVEAIENNQFAVLGAPVFARGHLRKYAVLLGLPVERVQQLYQGLNDRPSNPELVPVIHRESEPSIPMSPDSKQRRLRKQPAQWTLAMIGGAIAVAATVAWFAFSNSKESDSTASMAAISTVSAPIEAAGATNTIVQAQPIVSEAVNALPTTSKSDTAARPILAGINSTTPKVSCAFVLVLPMNHGLRSTTRAERGCSMT